VLQPTLMGPLMVSHSSHVTKCSDIGDVHELDDARFGYLVTLQDGFLSIHYGASSHVKSYSPHQFSRHFGFRQWISGVLLKDPRPRAVSYEDALYY